MSLTLYIACVLPLLVMLGFAWVDSRPNVADAPAETAETAAEASGPGAPRPAGAAGDQQPDHDPRADREREPALRV